MCFSAVLLFSIAAAAVKGQDQASSVPDLAKQAAVVKNLQCIEQEGAYFATRFWEQVKTASSSDRELDVLFRDICKRISKTISCTDELYEIGGPSGTSQQTDEERRFSSALVKELHSMERYLCDDGGKKMVLFVESGGIECFEQSSAELQQGCPVNQHLNDLWDSSLGVRGSQDRIAESYDSRIASQCRVLNSTQACINDILMRQCANKKVASLVDGLFQSVLMKQPCGNSSLALQAPLLLTVMAAFLMAIQQFMLI